MNNNLIHVEDIENDEDFECPQFEFIENINKRLIYIMHCFRERKYIYTLCCLLIGFIICLFPIFKFVQIINYNLYFDIIINHSFYISHSVSYGIFFCFLINFYIIIVFIWKIIILLLVP